MKKVILGLMLFTGIASVSAQTKPKNVVTTAKAKTEKAGAKKTEETKAAATNTANATKESALSKVNKAATKAESTANQVNAATNNKAVKSVGDGATKLKNMTN